MPKLPYSSINILIIQKRVICLVFDINITNHFCTYNLILFFIASRDNSTNIIIYSSYCL